jgi:hypothetical protein
MPCQLCKSSLHTLAKCTANIDALWGPIRKVIHDEPFALRKQYEFISIYTVPMLKIIHRRLGFVTAAVDKTDLIYRIISYFFHRKIPNNHNSNPLTPTNITDVSKLVDAYASLLMWRPTSEKKLRFRESAYSWLNMYYRNAFCPEYIRLRQTNIGELTNDQGHLAFILTEQAREELRSVAYIRAIELGMAPEQELDLEKAHLKKLKIKVKLDKHLELKECFMCYDLKPHTKLGCGHEYCTDCLVGTAKVRTKTFITCAVCRTEIKEVKVLTKELKEDLISQLKKE